MTGRPIPIHVVTGFLGAGKSTLLNALLRRPELAATAVIVNEFGAVGIDHHLIRSTGPSCSRAAVSAARSAAT